MMLLERATEFSPENQRSKSMDQAEVQTLFRQFAAPLAGYAATSPARKELAEMLARNLWTAMIAGPEMEEETWKVFKKQANLDDDSLEPITPPPRPRCSLTGSGTFPLWTSGRANLRGVSVAIDPFDRSFQHLLPSLAEHRIVSDEAIGCDDAPLPYTPPHLRLAEGSNYECPP
jgi:hypothetical protein